jgi:hypothetical protein
MNWQEVLSPAEKQKGEQTRDSMGEEMNGRQGQGMESQDLVRGIGKR